MKSDEEIGRELPRIIDFIHRYVLPGEQVVVPVSGGLDSDVVARLCTLALGRERVRLFIVRQPCMEEKYLANAQRLAEDLGVPLAVVEAGDMNRQLIGALQEADPDVGFDLESLLDPARANCSLRTALISSYQDKGYLIAANSNRSEIELGFFMPFGDNLGHFKPISHLYKSEVKKLAVLLCSRDEVISQSPSAGFWEGENDLEDIAYWLYNGGPIPGGRTFTDQDVAAVEKLRGQLSQEKIDESLILLHEGCSYSEIQERTSLPVSIVEALDKTVKHSARAKNRDLMARREST